MLWVGEVGLGGIIAETLEPRFQDSHNFKDTLLFSLKSISTCQFLIGEKTSPHGRYYGGCLFLHQAWESGRQAQGFSARYQDSQLRGGGKEIISDAWGTWQVGDLGFPSHFLSLPGHLGMIPL